MSRSKKGGLIARRKSALQRLEATYKKFLESKSNKPKWITCKRGDKPRIHESKTYQQECDRLLNEISILKSKLHM